MCSIFEQLNNIDDDNMLNTVRLSEIIDDALIMVVDNAKEFELAEFIDSYIMFDGNYYAVMKELNK